MPEEFRERIDRTVQKIREFSARYPKGQAVAELIPSGNAKAAMEGLESPGYVPHIVSANERKFGRWLPVKDAQPEDPEDDYPRSYRYFTDRYESLTWLVSDKVQATNHVPYFQINNTSGSGHAVLEVGLGCDGAACIEDLNDGYEGHGFDRAVLFTGGWGDPSVGGFVFDLRQRSKAGECRIYRFTIDEPEASLPHEDEIGSVKGRIEGFDIWLEKRVDKVIAALEPVLAKLQ